VLEISSVVLKDDASAYAYAYEQQRSSLFLINGAK
jgi:hypothetical protein